MKSQALETAHERINTLEIQNEELHDKIEELKEDLHNISRENVLLKKLVKGLE